MHNILARSGKFNNNELPVRDASVKLRHVLFAHFEEKKSFQQVQFRELTIGKHDSAHLYGVSRGAVHTDIDIYIKHRKSAKMP